MTTGRGRRFVTIQHRRGTAAEWAEKDPVLAYGELGVESTVAGGYAMTKVGDGVTPWSALPYVTGPSNVTPELLAPLVDPLIAAHDQAETVHANATSGRDFVALFQNGLI